MFSIPAYVAIFGVWILALFPDGRLLPPAKLAPDKVSLLFLFATFALANFPRWRAKFLENRDAATFLALAALLLVFHLADRGGPREGWQITFPFAPDDPVFVSWAARVAVLGAILSAPLWWKNGGAPERAFVAGVFGLGILAMGSLWFMSQYFPVGLDGVLNPAPIAQLLVQLVPFCALALLARAVTHDEKSRALLLKVAPILLLVIWARLQFSPTEAPVLEDE